MLDRLTIERMRAWTSEKPLVLALSGGGDSVALLHLLVAELGAERLRAAVVDHALREGSDADAKRSAQFAAELGVAATVLTLTWAPGAKRAQQAAREARYRALCNYARSEGLNAIAVGHTADDQAETMLMRAANASSWRGLAGIAPFAYAPVWPEGRGVALARPLLSTRRGDLRAYLQDRRAAWIEDPANTNPKYERIRVRRRLQALEANGLHLKRLLTVASRLRGRADALDSEALGLIEAAAHPDLQTSISKVKWAGRSEVRGRALSVLVAAVAGSQTEPSSAEAAVIEQRVFASDHRGNTHSGVAFASDPEAVYLRRDPGAALGRAGGARALRALDLYPGVEAIWDGRIAVTAPAEGWRITPARNAELVAFDNGLVHKRYDEARRLLHTRALVSERIRHAFAPDINRAKP